MPHSKLIIVNACGSSAENIRLFIDTLTVSLEHDLPKTMVYSDQDYGSSSFFVPQENIEFIRAEEGKVSHFFASCAEEIKLYDSIILIDVDAIPSKGWLSALERATSVQDVAASISRRVVRHNHQHATDASPYGKGPNDFDISLDARCDQLIDPGFDEVMALSSIKSVCSFCAFFKSSIFQEIDLDKLSGVDNLTWIDSISRKIRFSLNQSIVYTPDSKVFDSSYFLA